MIFNWKYHDGTRRVPKDYLYLGHKEIGYVHRQGEEWRAVCNLPDSCEFGGYYMQNFPHPGIARSTLELVATKWVSEACLWRDEPLGGTLSGSDTKD
ncbi:hypothetical protein ACLMYS_003810 [Salmonella enterica]